MYNKINSILHLGGGKRSSNFEVLRIVSMFLIVFHHLLAKGAGTCGYTHPYSIQSDGMAGIFMNGLAIIGVNVFILISGWFGIRRLWTQIVRLVADCFIYGSVAYVFCLLALGHPFALKELVRNQLFTGNWFVVSFIMLILVAPMLEKAVSNADRNEMLRYVLLLSIVNLVFGYILGNMNANGYNFLNFIYLYFIARTLRLYSDTAWFVKVSRYGLLAWVCCAALLTCGFIIYSRYVSYSVDHTVKFFAYNNPIVILSSVSFFAWFSLKKMQSDMINRLARGTFGTYLLHTAITIQVYRNFHAGRVYAEYGYVGLAAMALAVFACCMAVSLGIERMKFWKR